MQNHNISKVISASSRPYTAWRNRSSVHFNKDRSSVLQSQTLSQSFRTPFVKNKDLIIIEMGKDKVGLVIGDVTGKSVSGALVMSASRSVFRMLSEVEMTVDEIMISANRRTKKDIKSGMFVALLYAVLDAKDRTLSLCSAGQTQPIQLYAETGEASLVETKGDIFPLGILEDAEYQEMRLQLTPGDKVVFYTDGIVEAMNEKKEMFGFERLTEVVQGARSMSADSLLKVIIDRVNEFTGGAAQHDDLTVIVLSVTE